MSKWVVCGSGPSLSRTDFAMLKRHRSWNVMAINCAWRQVPWARAMYAGDLDWWTEYGEEARDFKGEKWTRNPEAAKRYRLKSVIGIRDREGLCRIPGCIYLGGNSGFQGTHIARTVYGAEKIVLLGFDMHLRDGAHFHGDHPKGMLNCPPNHVVVWIRKFRHLVHDLEQDGVKIINATPGTDLTCMPCMPLHRALRC